ncbi:hypothetical protein LNQ81_15275 [Myroides sp. M-43]|uniref:hypothetical protein n=1 Tax=Myroides oncorhynchi TaxID=2893756 RepID=UPI001E42BF2B|nr:hypothetical protein [Myroides oncorhynchi]MCC9044037.1 hypothetical protein [Myroides oncorhynchi]
MTAEEFVKGFYKEKQYLLKDYLTDNSKTKVAHLIKSLNLNENQTNIMREIIDATLTDVLYTVLLGLDGEAVIGDNQSMYEIKDEDGNIISGNIESYAYQYFQE